MTDNPTALALVGGLGLLTLIWIGNAATQPAKTPSPKPPPPVVKTAQQIELGNAVRAWDRYDLCRQALERKGGQSTLFGITVTLADCAEDIKKYPRDPRPAGPRDFLGLPPRPKGM